MPQPGYEKIYAENPAQNYERYFVPAIGAPVALDLVESAALRPGERVLDVACGTGIVARLVAERVGPKGTVAGLDINPGMIAVARQATQPGARIDWYESPAEAIPLQDDKFDVVLCGMGLQSFPDKQAALREIRRVLVTGGRFVANVPGPTPPILKVMDEEIARHINSESAAFVRAVFSLHDAEDLRTLARDAGFTGVDIWSAVKPLRLPLPADFLWQYIYSTPLANAIAQVDEDHRAALESDFVTRCQRFVKEGVMLGEVNMTTLIVSK
jgi:ubiquinone/menaquinone biosynthesis C-methylase UbiE